MRSVRPWSKRLFVPLDALTLASILGEEVSQHMRALQDFAPPNHSLGRRDDTGLDTDRYREGVYQRPRLLGFSTGRPGARTRVNSAVIGGAVRRALKENAKNNISPEDPSKKAQLIFRIPSADSRISKFISLLKDLPKLSAEYSACPQLALYTGSFGASAKLISEQIPRLLRELPSTNHIEVTKEMCERLYDIFVGKLVDQIADDGVSSIQHVDRSMVETSLNFRGGNIVNGCFDLLARVQSKLASDFTAGSANVELNPRYVASFEIKGGGQSQSDQNKRTELEAASNFLNQFPPALLTEQHAQLLRKARIYNKIKNLDLIREAFLHLSSAANRALIVMSRETRIPNTMYNGINTNVVHFWLASLRYEQKRWQEASLSKLHLDELEKKAAPDIITSNHERIKSSQLGYKADPPISYLKTDIKDELWRTTLTTSALDALNYFHLFADVNIQRMTVAETEEYSRQREMSQKSSRQLYNPFELDDDDDDDYSSYW